MLNAPESLKTATAESVQVSETATHGQGKTDFPASMVCDLSEAKAFCLGYGTPNVPVLAAFGGDRLHAFKLPRLTKRDREEIRLKLAELDGDGWADADDPLTAADKALIEAHERNPATSIPWKQFEAGLKRRLGE